MSDYRGKRHEPLASEEFIGCCALCGADLGHWWHEPVAIEAKMCACGGDGDPFIGTRSGWVHTEASCYEGGEHRGQ